MFARVYLPFHTPRPQGLAQESKLYTCSLANNKLDKFRCHAVDKHDCFYLISRTTLQCVLDSGVELAELAALVQLTLHSCLTL